MYSVAFIQCGHVPPPQADAMVPCGRPLAVLCILAAFSNRGSCLKSSPRTAFQRTAILPNLALRHGFSHRCMAAPFFRSPPRSRLCIQGWRMAKGEKETNVLELEVGRKLSQTEFKFLGGKFDLCGDTEDSNVGTEGEGSGLPRHVLELLRDNRDDVIEDLEGGKVEEGGLISQKEFDKVLLEGGGESGTALGQLLQAEEMEALRSEVTDAATKKISLKLVETLLNPSDAGEQKQVDLFFGSEDDAKRVRLSVPVDPSTLLDDAIEQFDASGNPDDFVPYYVKLWPSAFVLAAEFLERPEEFKGKRIAEVSAGLGLPGLAAAKAGASRTMLTEYDAIATDSIARNAALNSLDVETSLLDWFRAAESQLVAQVDAWDYLAFADVMYESRFIEPIASLIASLLRQNRGCKALLSDRARPQRAALPEFQRTLNSLGLQVEKEIRIVNLHKASVSHPLDSESHAIILLTISLPE